MMDYNLRSVEKAQDEESNNHLILSGTTISSGGNEHTIVVSRGFSKMLFRWIAILGILLVSIGTTGCICRNDEKESINLYGSSSIKEGRKMLDKVMLIAEPDQSGRVYIEFQRLGHLWISTEDEIYALRIRALKRCLNDGSPICVIPNEETCEAESVFSPHIDPVVAMQDDTEKKCIWVTLLKSPTLYVLHKNHPRFIEMYNLLQQSMSSGLPAIVAVRPGGKIIWDVWLNEDTD